MSSPEDFDSEIKSPLTNEKYKQVLTSLGGGERFEEITNRVKELMKTIYGDNIEIEKYEEKEHLIKILQDLPSHQIEMILNMIFAEDGYLLNKISKSKAVKEIKKAILEAEKKKKGDLEEHFELPGHLNAWFHGLEKYGSSISLVEEETMDLNSKHSNIYDEIPSQKTKLFGKEVHTPSIVKKLVKNWENLKTTPEFKESIQEIQKLIQEGKDVLLVTSHGDWSTQMIAPLVTEEIKLKDENNEEVKFPLENKITILGPGATALKKFGVNPRKVSQTMGKVGMLIPSTKNAIPKGLTEEQEETFRTKSKSYNFRFIKSLLNYFKNKESNSFGKIMNMAPAGTTDKVENGKFITKELSEESLKFIEFLLERGEVHIVPLGIVSNMFKGWKGIMNPQDIQVHFGKIRTKDDLKDGTEENPYPTATAIMHDMASAVKDAEGNVIGEYKG